MQHLPIHDQRRARPREADAARGRPFVRGRRPACRQSAAGFAATGLLALALAGCGDDDPVETTGTDAPDPNSEAVETDYNTGTMPADKADGGGGPPQSDAGGMATTETAGDAASPARGADADDGDSSGPAGGIDRRDDDGTGVAGTEDVGTEETGTDEAGAPAAPTRVTDRPLPDETGEETTSTDQSSDQPAFEEDALYKLQSTWASSAAACKAGETPETMAGSNAAQEAMPVRVSDSLVLSHGRTCNVRDAVEEGDGRIVIETECARGTGDAETLTFTLDIADDGSAILARNDPDGGGAADGNGETTSLVACQEP